MTTHSLLSPSTAHRWMTCPGSVALCHDIPPEESEYAAEGTAAHALAESLLTGKPYALPPEYDTPELRGYVQTYVDFVSILGGVRDVEVKLDLRPWLAAVPEDNAAGTADAVVWVGNELYIVDLKYGMSFVGAPWNPQLALYALGYLALCQRYDKPDMLHLCIVQPRIGNISQWDITPDELSDFEKIIVRKATIAIAMADLPESDWIMVPDESACKYCRARGVCRSLFKVVQNTAEGEPVKLTPDELAEAYGRTGLVRLWADAVEKSVYGRLLHGEPVPGLKLVEGRKGTRKWRSESAALEAINAAGITADVYEHKLLSPAKMEKLLKDEKITKEQWGALAPEITQENTKPVIADELDKRPEYKAAELIYPNMEEKTND